LRTETFIPASIATVIMVSLTFLVYNYCYTNTMYIGYPPPILVAIIDSTITCLILLIISVVQKD
jgi:hypothetical protein